MIELCLSVLYSNEIMERFFSFMKLVKSDWSSKLQEEIEALLCIKAEGPKIEQFIKEHSSDPTAFWWNKETKECKGTKKRREWEMEKI